MPEGFCGWAWADIQKLVYGMARAGRRCSSLLHRQVPASCVFTGEGETYDDESDVKQ